MSAVASTGGKGPSSGPFPSGKMSAWAVKLVILGLIDVLGIWALAKSLTAEWWLAVVFLALVLVAVNVVYFRRGGLPFKYLLPGLVFLIAFQLYPAGYTFGASFTNYGTGHLIPQEQVVTAIVAQSARPVAGSPSYQVTPLEKGGDIFMLITDPTAPNTAKLGSNEELVPAPDATFSSGKATGLEGYESLNLGTLASNPDWDQQWQALTVPWDEDAGVFLKAQSPARAAEVKSTVIYDKESDTFTDSTTGVVYSANGEIGLYTAPGFDLDGATTGVNAGKFLTPGWPVFVGVDNYTRMLTDPGVRANFIPILIWSFVFAIGTVLMQFVFGLLLAMVMQEKRMKGQKVYRILLVLPYALPIFMTALVWKGMFNKDFGIINQILGVDIDWLGNGTLAKIALLTVNLWIGYSYMFLVVTGALTSIPSDLREAAFVDGASGFKAFRTVVLPLLMVSVSPLLIASFSFNFNNFTLVELLTGGGPFPGSPVQGGQTDLLITYTYRLAFGTSEQLLGFASAISMLIFVIVAGFSAFGFRLTRKLEEIKA
ncbi:MAG: arabinogalactan oligomer / maltooligosaccharide transport system permease protein [Actinomycetota bacterium]|nr:arabinogalactan oligomer / maltooligosaccharide transport system permease protein [Actinomycetota bacterium]